MAIEEHLQVGEKILYRAQPTALDLVPSALGLSLALIAGGTAYFFTNSVWALAAGGVLALFALVALVRRLVVRANSEFVLTDRRVLHQTGVFGKASKDAYLDKINNVEHRQTFVGRIFGFGDVEVDTASEGGVTLYPRVTDPLGFKRAILASADSVRSGRQAAYFAPPAPAPARPDSAERLRELDRLLAEGLIRAEEHAKKRAEILERL